MTFKRVDLPTFDSYIGCDDVTVHVLTYRPAKLSSRDVRPSQREPDELEELDFAVFSHEGHRVWTAEISNKDYARLYSEALTRVKEYMNEVNAL